MTDDADGYAKYFEKPTAATHPSPTRWYPMFGGDLTVLVRDWLKATPMKGVGYIYRVEWNVVNGAKIICHFSDPSDAVLFKLAWS